MLTGDVLVLAGRGKTGRRVAERLRRKGLGVRAASRSGAGPERFDWDDKSTWDAALHGARAVYLVPREAANPEGAPLVAEFAARAVEAGAERLVLLSAFSYPDATGPVEEAVRKAGARQWTVLRPTWFAQNFSEDFLRDPVRAGEVRMPEGEGAVPFVDAEDIADAAVAALTGPPERHHAQEYGLTGPRALTFREGVAAIARATGRDLRYVPVPEEEYAASLHAAGVPADTAHLMLDILRPALRGALSTTANGVHESLSRPPRDFTQYVNTTAREGGWGGVG